jgi:hypothetical protein
VDEFQRNPSSLLDEKFVHLVAVGDDEMRRAYEVVEFGMTKEVGWWFRICYEDTRKSNASTWKKWPIGWKTALLSIMV